MIYILAGNHETPFKVGYSRNADTVKTRVNDIQKLLPWDIRVLHTEDGCRILESLIHEYLRPFNMRSEWYRRCINIVTFVSACIEVGCDEAIKQDAAMTRAYSHLLVHPNDKDKKRVRLFKDNPYLTKAECEKVFTCSRAANWEDAPFICGHHPDLSVNIKVKWITYSAARAWLNSCGINASFGHQSISLSTFESIAARLMKTNGAAPISFHQRLSGLYPDQTFDGYSYYKECDNRTEQG